MFKRGPFSFIAAMRTLEQSLRFRWFIVTVCLIVLPACLSAGSAENGEPWSVSVNAPVFGKPVRPLSQEALATFSRGRSVASDVGYGWLRIYQTLLAPLGTAKCPMTPSCSTYSILAIHKHGVACGIMMTADRLIHEADEKRWVRLVGTELGPKYADPLENNDFWWGRK